MNCSCPNECRCKNCTCSARAAVFSALGNETRLQLLMTLRNGEATVNELVQASNEEQSTVSHALSRLSEAGLVSARTQGKTRVYTLNKDVVLPLLNATHNHMNAYKEKLRKPCCCGSRT